MALANMYSKCHRPGDARRVLDRMPVQDRVALNALVAGYTRNGLAGAPMEMLFGCRRRTGSGRTLSRS